MTHHGTQDSHAASEEARRLLEQLLRAGPPLAERLTNDLWEGLPPGTYDALIIDRSTRDRLAILEPRCARWFRRLFLGTHLRPWYQEYPGTYLIAVPHGWTAATFGDLPEPQAWECFQARFPALGQYLRPLAERLRRPGRGGYWWELRESEASPALYRPVICWPDEASEPCFSLVGVDVVLCGGAFTTRHDPFVLGVLASRTAWFILTQICAMQHGPDGRPQYRLTAEQIALLPVPQGNEAAEHAIGTLAAQLTATAQERHELRRLVCQRMQKDFGPPGSTMSRPLIRWWEQDANAIRAEMTRVFGGDVPERYRAEWQIWFEQQCAAHSAATESMRMLETQLHTQVGALFHLDAAGAAALERWIRS